MSLYDTALKIAKEAHEGQVDKAGVEYIKYPVYVANQVDTEAEKATALLHDVIEDSDLTVEDLISRGIPIEVVQAVSLLTKDKEFTYHEYLSLVKSNTLATTVKLADLKHNSDLSRIPNPTKKDFERLEKYKKAIEFLST